MKRVKSLTPQQEKFAQLAATGMNQSAAYRVAYNAKRMKAITVNNEASKLARNPHIAARVAEIREPVIRRTRYGLEEAMKESDKALNQALESGQTGAAVSAVALRARLHGLLVEDRQNARGAYSEMSDEELEQVIAEANRVIKSA